MSMLLWQNYCLKRIWQEVIACHFCDWLIKTVSSTLSIFPPLPGLLPLGRASCHLASACGAAHVRGLVSGSSETCHQPQE